MVFLTVNQDTIVRINSTSYLSATSIALPYVDCSHWSFSLGGQGEGKSLSSFPSFLPWKKNHN